ncbi:MAG: proline--tRNA ligase [Halobacteriovoraceae bacterium]|nr:proline--tRNA ligase [Halobacteriovoraceae bacterium]
MKLSTGFWQTYKESPADAEIVSHKLMMRAGLLHKTAAGIYTYLPMMVRILRKIENIIRNEHDKNNCFEITMSVVTPAELWKESGRWESFGPQILKAKDRAERDLCLSPTNEESVVDVFRKNIKSYKQLPLNLYQINTKFRDEIRPRFGVMRGREFTMKDAYSFHIDKKCLDTEYDKMYSIYENICRRMGLEFIAVEADAGAMAQGEAKTHEFQVLANSGEDKVIKCNNCTYSANVERAKTTASLTKRTVTKNELIIVDTPEKQTISEVCEFLKIQEEGSLKSLIYKGISGETEDFYLCLLLGNDSMNEVKFKNISGHEIVTPATDNELLKLGLLKGFIGPVGSLDKNLKVIVDSSVDLSLDYVVGANQKDKHFKNFIFSRDCKLEFTHNDLRESKEGDDCLVCKKSKSIKEIRGIEVGHIFQLGDKYTKSMNVTVLDQNGKAVNPIMGCYGIGVSRMAAAAIEQHHDDKGIIWPISIAPYEIYFASICKSEEYVDLSNEIFVELREKGFEVLYDDRNAGAGFKFKDAELIGCPFILVFGERDFKESGVLEIRTRKTGDSIKVSKNEIFSKLEKMIMEERKKFEL